MGEALPPSIQEIVAQRIANSTNDRLINRIQADCQTMYTRKPSIVQRKHKDAEQHRAAKQNKVVRFTTLQMGAREQLATPNRYAALSVDKADDSADESGGQSPPQYTPLVERIGRRKESPQTSSDIQGKVPLIDRIGDEIELPPTFKGDAAQASNFIRQNEEYHRATEGQLDFPIRKVALALSLMKGHESRGWIRTVGDWLDSLNKDVDDLPIVWELFKREFVQHFKMTSQPGDTRQRLESLRMKGLEAKEYVDQFEKLADQVGLKATNPETTRVFMAGLTEPVRRDVCSRPTYGYRMARAHALQSAHIQHLIIAALRSKEPQRQKSPTPQESREPRKRLRAEDYLDQTRERKRKATQASLVHTPLQDKSTDAYQEMVALDQILQRAIQVVPSGPVLKTAN
jgi:hypothetical protein